MADYTRTAIKLPQEVALFIVAASKPYSAALGPPSASSTLYIVTRRHNGNYLIYL